MKLVDSITIAALNTMAQKMYGDFVKAVVDIKDKKLAVDAEMHVDEEQLLLEEGSKQENLWGINLYPSKFGTDEFVEFDSMINIRPRASNMSRSVEDLALQQKIRDIVTEKIHE